MTLELTSSGTLGWEHDPRHNGTEDEEMIYTVDQSQLLRLWSVIRCFGDIRKIPDPEVQAEILTKAQILLTAWLGRSLQELVGFLGELHAKGVDLYLHQQGIDTGTPAGKAMFQMMGVFAEFERAMIVERVKSGLARARSVGKRLGRRPVNKDVVERIREQLATGAGILKTAKALGVGTGTVHRVKRSMAAVAA